MTALGDGLVTLVTLCTRGRVAGGAVTFPLVGVIFFGSAALVGATCEGYTTPVTRIPFQGRYRDDGNHNNIDTLQYESSGSET